MGAIEPSSPLFMAISLALQVMPARAETLRACRISIASL